MIERLLPATARWAERFDHEAVIQLFPAELEVVRRAVDKRRREFASVRSCARAAMAELGLPATAVLPGPRGEPRWPDGVVGTMTHCAGYCAAVLARSTDLHAVGIDAEPDEPLPDGVLDSVSSPSERAWIAGRTRQQPRINWDRLLFCAKEATYKAWYPLTGRWLGFEDAEVGLDDADVGLDDADVGLPSGSGRFTVRLTVPGPEVDGVRLQQFHGRWTAADGLVLAAVVVP